MDMDLKDITEFAVASARSLGAELTSPWFYLQFGLMLAAAGVAYVVETVIRARVDMTSLAMRWPLPLRRFARVLVACASTATFAIVLVAARPSCTTQPGRAAATCSWWRPSCRSPG